MSGDNDNAEQSPAEIYRSSEEGYYTQYYLPRDDDDVHDYRVFTVVNSEDRVCQSKRMAAADWEAVGCERIGVEEIPEEIESHWGYDGDGGAK